MISTKPSTMTACRAVYTSRTFATPAVSISPYHIEERQQRQQNCDINSLSSEYDYDGILKRDGGNDDQHQKDVVYMGNGLSIQYVEKADGMDLSFIPWRVSHWG